MRPLAGRVAVGVAVGAGSAALGAGVAGSALLVHRAGVPWGLLLAVAASALGGLALAAVGAGRAGVLGYAVGWCGVVLLVLAGSPEGDYLVGGDLLGWSFLLLACGSVFAATVLGIVLTGRSTNDGQGRRT